MSQCEYLTNKGRCTRQALPDNEFCKQHFDMVVDDQVDVNIQLPVEDFKLIHITSYDKLSSIFESGSLNPSSLYNATFLSFIFPGDKLKPFESSNNKFVVLFFNPDFFKKCSDKKLPTGEYGTCYYTPYWAAGARKPETFKYDWKKNLQFNLNKAFELQRSLDFKGLGIERANELVVKEKVPLDAISFDGVYIPSNFNPKDTDFDINKLKAEFQQYTFIDDTNPEDIKRYRKFIDFKAFKNISVILSEERTLETETIDESDSESEGSYPDYEELDRDEGEQY
jgi:hypothetical protein